VQVGTPLVHSRVAVAAQRLVEAQADPWTQAMQAPAGSHTWPAPQDVPAVAAPPSTQTGEPVEQSVTPSRQGTPSAQLAPAVQAPQVPAAVQTWPDPQAVPAVAKVRSVQTGVPDAHSRVAEAAQGLSEVQAWSCTQAMQAWAASQTRPVPQLVPGGAKAWSVQTAAPVEHS
jgi:hypothetical protein